MGTNTKVKEILFLGPEGSNTETAKNIAVSLLGLEEYKPVIKYNIQEIISEVDNNKDTIAVVPIENSIEGQVRETVDKIIRTKNYVRIFQEIIIPISHCLISKSGDRAKIKTISSHPQALAQCNGYIYKLGKNLGINIENVISSSTSEAVSSLEKLDESHAAIASENAADLYNMKIVEKGINDEPDNKTRFICIGHHYPSKTGNDRTSIAFTTVNKPGALVDVLLVFKELNLNMSYIDSRPSKRNLGEYTFYVDFDGHVEDDNLKIAIERINPLISFYRLIGSYPRYKG